MTDIQKYDNGVDEINYVHNVIVYLATNSNIGKRRPSQQTIPFDDVQTLFGQLKK